MTATALSFSKKTVLVDAPPTGAPAGRFDNALPSPINDVAVTTPAFPNLILLPTSTKSPKVPVVPENDVAVKIPVTTAPVLVVVNF